MDDQAWIDSVVQAPTGIAAGEVDDDGGEPGALPCQLLDHGTGYLAAAAALDGLRRQAEGGGTHVRRLSLARTVWWLTDLLPTFVHQPCAGRGFVNKSRRVSGWSTSTIPPDRSPPSPRPAPSAGVPAVAVGHVVRRRPPAVGSAASPA